MKSNFSASMLLKRGLIEKNGPRGQYALHFINTMWFSAAFGFLALICWGIWGLYGPPTGQPFSGNIFWALLGMMACMAVGGFLGVLFGIPRIESSPTLQNAIVTAGSADNRGSGQQGKRVRVRQNDSLEQIADWLTKTIVGVTLVQANDARHQLIELSRACSFSMYGVQGTYVPGLATILFYSVIGFLLGYVWMRRYWGLELDTIETELDDRQSPDTLDEATRVIGAAVRAGNESKIPKDQLEALSHAEGWPTLVPDYAQDDPWKGRFGGKASDPAKGRQLRIEYTPDDTIRDGRRWVKLRFIAEASGITPLEGSVRFFVHPTFPNPVREVTVKCGRAILELLAWGGDFTVGVQMDNGDSTLEAHVSTNAPSWLKSDAQYSDWLKS